MNPVFPRQFIALALSAAISMLAGMSADVHAAAEGTVDLLTTPPELTASVDPNIVVTFDDSGSMNSSYMPDSISGTTGNSRYYSSTTNLIYYNPLKTYPPPLKPDGSSLPNASYTNAWRDGMCANWAGTYCFASSNKRNLSNKFYQQFRDGNDGNAWGSDIPVALQGDKGGFWYDCPTPNSDAGCVRREISAFPAQQQNFANWYSYYRTRNLMTRSSISRTFGALGENIRVTWQTITSDPLPATRPIKELAGAWRTNFFDWLFNVRGNSNTPDRAATIRAGQFYARALTETDLDPYWNGLSGTDSKDLECRQNFHMLVTDGYWNEGNPTPPAGFFGVQDATTPATLPDGTPYSRSAAESRVIWDVPVSPPGGCGSNGSADCYPSIADIAFYYWAHDLQPGLANKVVPFLPDKKTGITGNTPVLPGEQAIQNMEVYYNPSNDPASWQHVVQFMITLGVAGNLTYSNDVDCADPTSDMCKLRKGQPNSAGITGWPQPKRNAAPGIDDTWHAAINSRGSYFSASDSDSLVQHLKEVIESIVARTNSSTPVSLSLPLLTTGTSGYAAGYDSTDWQGSLIREELDPATGQPTGILSWDAGCTLTGGTFDTATGVCTPPTFTPGTNPTFGAPPQTRDPDTRVIVTSKINGAGSYVGVPFRWGSIGAIVTNGLDQVPAAVTLCDPVNAPASCDTYGQQRLEYLRGDRTHEGSLLLPPMRKRSSVLGAIINAQPKYVSSPRGGYYDIFPTGTPEAAAYAIDPNSGYAAFQYNNRTRTPIVYVGSNDGMLHAFDAATGIERWGFVPSLLAANGRLARSTADNAGLTPGVDSPPLEADVFINGSWRTILAGSLRLGGRGIYALDVTNVPPTNATEASVAGNVLWEFGSGKTPSTDGDPVCAPGARECVSLGYTYNSVNVARLHAGNKWVALVSSGYFPSRPEDAANPSDATEAAAKRTSLLVIDMQTGQLIRELRTSIAPQTLPSGFKTFGLSTANVFDLGSDQIDDLAYAGDLAGNLWRFDLRDSDPANWKVDLLFTTYGDGGAANVGDQPIVFNPTALADPVTRTPILVFGTGKFLGRDDRTSSIPEQAFYGIRDYHISSAPPADPIRVNQLITQNLVQDAPDVFGNATRRINDWTAPTGTLPPGTPAMIVGSTDASGNPITVKEDANGWRMPLAIAAEPGERAERRAVPLYSANVAFLYTMIPKGEDPCDPGRRFGIMAIDASNGATIFPGGANAAPGTGLAGVVTNADTPPGDPVQGIGGSPNIVVPGLPQPIQDQIQQIVAGAIPPWHRGAWRELLDLQ